MENFYMILALFHIILRNISFYALRPHLLMIKENLYSYNNYTEFIEFIILVSNIWVNHPVINVLT